MNKLGDRIVINDTTWFEIYKYEPITKRKGNIYLIVMKDGKRVFEKRVARANVGTQKVFSFKLYGEFYELLLRK